MTVNHKLWGPWLKHDGKSMPIPAGTIVEVCFREEPKTALNGVLQLVGGAGVNLVYSWFWTPEKRATQSSLPIDRYHIKRPKGLDALTSILVEKLELEDA